MPPAPSDRDPFTRTLLVLTATIGTAVAIGGVRAYARLEGLHVDVAATRALIENPHEGIAAIRNRISSIERQLDVLHTNHEAMRVELVQARSALSEIEKRGGA